MKVLPRIKTNGSRVDWDFPGGPVVKTLRFQCRGHGFDPWGQGTKIPHAAQCGQKKGNRTLILTFKAHLIALCG